MTYPTGITVDADFTGGVLPSGWVFTRNSVATDSLYTDAAGSSYNTFAINQPRFLGASGMIVEIVGRTNYLSNSAAPVTQTTGSVPTGNKVLWVIGTGSATITAGTGVATGLGTATPGVPLFFNVTTAGTFTVTVAGTLNRFQLENGFTPTSFIVTAGSTGTRGGELATLATDTWYNPAAGTIAIGLSLPFYNSTLGNSGFFGLDDGTTNNRVQITTSTAYPTYLIFAGGAAQPGPGSLSAVVVPQQTPFRSAVRYSAAGSRQSATGVLGNNGAAITVPTLTRLAFIGGGSTNNLTFLMQRGQYWPFAMSDTDLLAASNLPPTGEPQAYSSAGAATASGRTLVAVPFTVNISAQGHAIPRGTAIVPTELKIPSIPPSGGVGNVLVEVDVPQPVIPEISYPTSDTFTPLDAYDYLDRIPRWNRGHPLFVAEVYMLCAACVVLTQFYQMLTTLFDVDTAIGVQLDQIGQWVGRSRRIANPITDVYFTWDLDGLGWDQGVWLGPFDPVEGLVSLDDETYRTVIKTKIASNNWDGTIGGAQDAMAPIVALSPGTLLYMKDGQDMTYTWGITGKLPNLLSQSLILGGIIPFKPEGVRLDTYVTSVDGTALFGFDAQSAYIDGWDRGAWGTALTLAQEQPLARSA